MKIIIDVMGGDNAPEAGVIGVLDAAAAMPEHSYIIVGRENEIRDTARAAGRETELDGIRIVHADGVITMEDNGSEDEKIIAIPFTDPNYNCYKNINDLPKHVFDEMQHFFTVYKQLEGKNTAVNTVLGREEALSIIEKSLEGYKEKLFEILNK